MDIYEHLTAKRVHTIFARWNDWAYTRNEDIPPEEILKLLEACKKHNLVVEFSNHYKILQFIKTKRSVKKGRRA